MRPQGQITPFRFERLTFQHFDNDAEIKYLVSIVVIHRSNYRTRIDSIGLEWTRMDSIGLDWTTFQQRQKSTKERADIRERENTLSPKKLDNKDFLAWFFELLWTGISLNALAKIQVL